MSNKTKFDYEIENFVKNFAEKKDKSIVLYGTGRMTATLLAGNTNYHFVGLCDRDETLVGTQMYGLPILSREEAEKADLLVINTSQTYWNTIYKRISDWKIPIYLLNGKEASKSDIKINSDNAYWNKSYEELCRETEKYEVVSLDIFDTLIMRKVMFPYDVFRLVENKLKIKDIDFVSVRKKASSMLECPTIDEIYEKISELTGKATDEVEHWKEEEILIEKSLIVTRQDMVALCQGCMKKKEVYLISDMYFPKATIAELLAEVGMEIPLENILVSCEINKTKRNGDLWKYYQAEILKGRKGLHIGDDNAGDYIEALKAGVDAYRIMSAYEMLENSSISGITPFINSIYSSIAMGNICAEIFNSPFAINQTRGKVQFQNDKQGGYTILGPLMDSFCKWLLYNTSGKYKKLAFFAREGFLLIPLYEELKKIIGEEKAPQTVYLEISRRAVWGAYIQKEEDIYEIGEFPYQGSVREFLRDRFGVEVSDDTIERFSFKQVMELYIKEILEESRKERQSYREYLESLDLNETAYVDSQYYGTTQYYLGKVMDQTLTGYYFCACQDEANKYFGANRLYGCFNYDDCNVHEQAQFLEAYFTSEDGMLERITMEGEKVYSQKMSNQIFFNVRYEMQSGIKKFMKDAAELMKNCNLDPYTSDRQWADRLFGQLMNNGFIATDNMKKSFFFDNKITSKREMPIWE